MDSPIKLNSVTANCAKGDFRADLLLACGLAVVFAATTWFWFMLDHRLPANDPAGHILNCFGIRDLLHHFRFWSGHWWYQALTVNRYYPPTHYFFCGFLKLLFGPGYAVDAASITFFDALLSVTLFGIARYLKMSRAASALSVVIVNFFPLVSELCHTFLLDLPLLSMVSLGIWTLLWWREKPSWMRAMISGLVLIAACLTKQLAAPYMVGAGIYLLAESAGSFGGKRRTVEIMQLMLIAFIVLIGCLPWALINIPFITHGIAAAGTVSDAKAVQYSFLGTLVSYLRLLPDDLSPLLLGCAILGLITSTRKAHRELLPVTLAGLIGMTLMFSIHRIWPIDDRYIAPAMLMFAVYAAAGVMGLFRFRLRIVSALAIVTIVLASLQFISFNFAPYPISQPAFIASISQTLGVKWMNMDKDNPRPITQDWGQNFVLDTIYESDHNNPSYLNVMANSADLNAHSFELLVKMRRSPVKPTTYRLNTQLGDKVKFDPKTVLYCDWFLFKDGDPGYKYFDQQSSEAVDKMRQFVEQSGYYDLAAKRLVPDGTNVYLYKKLHTPRPKPLLRDDAA